MPRVAGVTPAAERKVGQDKPRNMPSTGPAQIDPAEIEVVKDGPRFKGKPLVEAAVRNSLALTYNAVGQDDLGIPHAAAALEIRAACWLSARSCAGNRACLDRSPL